MIDPRDRQYPQIHDAEVKTWKLCPLCDGRGRHVNPSIDAQGLTADDFAEDPDFAEDYSRGTYDVTCRQCNGRRVVPEDEGYDEESAMLHEWDLEAEAERRMGA